MTARSLYELLLESMESQPGIGSDGAVGTANGHPQGDPLARTSVGARRGLASTASSFPTSDPNFRQLVHRPSATGAQAESNVGPEEPAYLWAEPQPNAVPIGAYDPKLTVPWGSPSFPSALPVWPGRGAVIPRPGVPLPPSVPKDLPKIPVPEIPFAWKLLGLGALFVQDEFRRRLLGEQGDSEGHDTVESPQAYPRVTPRPAEEEDDRGCMEEREQARKECKQADASGWKGDWGLGPYKNPRTKKVWSIKDCERGRVSERCGGNRVDRPNGKPKKRRYL